MRCVEKCLVLDYCGQCKLQHLFFCICYFSKTNERPAKWNTGQCLAHVNKPACAIWSCFDNVRFSQKFQGLFFPAALQLVSWSAIIFMYILNTRQPNVFRVLPGIYWKPYMEDRIYPWSIEIWSMIKRLSWKYIGNVNKPSTMASVSHWHYIGFTNYVCTLLTHSLT